MKNNFKPKEFYIKVNDVFVDLINENKRLNNELNNCLNVLNKFKLFLSKICLKFETNIDSEDKQELNQLKEEFNEIRRSKSKWKKTNVLIDDNISENNGNNDDLDYEIPEDESVLSGNESTDSDKGSDTRKGLKRSKRIETRNKSKTKTEVNAKQGPKEESNSLKFSLKNTFDSKKRRYVCPYLSCERSFQFRCWLKKHYNERHGPNCKQFKCDFIGCEFKTRNKGVFKHHKERHKENTSFQCNICKNLFKERCNLSLHKIMVHTPGPGHISCPREGCDKLFKDQRLLSTHIRLKHPLDKPFKCTECGKAFAAKYLLRKHQKDVHLIHTVEEPKRPKFVETLDSTTKRFVCPFPSCDKSYTQRYSLSSHFKTHDPNHVKTLFKCDFIGCDYETDIKNNLKQHKEKHSSVRRYQCDSCEKRFKSMSTLTKHKTNMHTTILAQFVCDYEGCDHRFKHKYALNRHIRQKHLLEGFEKKRFECTECGQTYANRTYLNEHKLTHLGHTFKCEECHKDFKFESYLRKHKEMFHLNPKTFSCNLCDFKTHRRDGFNMHMKLIHIITEKTVKCDFEGCPQMFKHIRVMKAHKRAVHMRQSIRVVCDWPGCDQTFKSKATCDDHKRSHLGKREFVCDVEGCGKAFLRSGTLRLHKRTHTKSAVCSWPECGHRFANNYYLSAHMNIHLNVKPYKCTINGCEQKFFSKDSRSQHLKNFHKIKTNV